MARHGARAVLGSTRFEPPVSLETRTWYNPDLESRHMIVPGLIAVIMSIIAAMLTALTIAREWERGTMEQLAATPVGRFEVVLGKLLPYVAIGLFDVAVTVVAGILIFGTPLRGDVVVLAAFTLLFLVGALGLGIFISAAVKSQVLAMQIAILATYLPAVLLSGFLFDVASMPTALRALTFLVPARYYVTVTRGVFLKGVGMEVLWLQGAFMLAFATLGLVLATRAFRKELAT
jgi:ABC-2 type transport system permease protein